MKAALIIPAAGSGERLGRGTPKALVDVAGRPLLRRTLDRLAAGATFVETVVLAPASLLATFESRLAGVSSALGQVKVREGGATRQASVAAGVAALESGADLVCVHDAARPLVAAETVRAVLACAAEAGAATAASRPVDSMRIEGENGVTSALDRSRLWLVETPQAFRRELLEQAHRRAVERAEAFTDDASLVEAFGQEIRMVLSPGRNLKVTVEADLVLVTELLRREAARP